MSMTDLLSSAHVVGILLGAVVPDPLLTQSTKLSRLGCMWMGFPSSPSSSLQSPESGNHPESKRKTRLRGSLPCPHGPTHVLSGETALPGSHVAQASHLRRGTSRGVWGDAQTQTEATGSVRSPLGVKGAWQERDAVALGQGSRVPSNGLTTAALGCGSFSRDILPFVWEHEGSRGSS